MEMIINVIFDLLFNSYAVAWAVKNNKKSILKFLIFIGMNISIVDENLKTPLMYAVENGNVDLVKLLLDSGAQINNIKLIITTELHLACEKGDMELVKLLLDYGADIDAVDSVNNKPLHIAAKYGHVEVFNMLIADNDANLKSMNNYDESPMCMAVKNGHVGFVNIFLDKVDNCRDLMLLALQTGQVKVAQILIKHIDLNYVDDSGQTLLMHAVKFAGSVNYWGKIVLKEGFIEIVSSLLAAGAKKDLLDKKGYSAFRYAAEKGYIEIAKLLFTYTDSQELISAAERGDSRIVNFLLKSEFKDEINLDFVDASGQTALMKAVQKGHINIVTNLLSSNNLKLDLVDNEGNTALKYALLGRDKKIVDKLSNAGARRDHDLYSPKVDWSFLAC